MKRCTGEQLAILSSLQTSITIHPSKTRATCICIFDILSALSLSSKTKKSDNYEGKSFLRHNYSSIMRRRVGVFAFNFMMWLVFSTYL